MRCSFSWVGLGLRAEVIDHAWPVRAGCLGTTEDPADELCPRERRGVESVVGSIGAGSRSDERLHKIQAAEPSGVMKSRRTWRQLGRKAEIKEHPHRRPTAGRGGLHQETRTLIEECPYCLVPRSAERVLVGPEHCGQE